ncbi:MAG: hypothetical protein KIS92_05790 [Planctomycetota bacterium]|nr:hypothetical protein [Planctomycetota bacterium]
MLRPRFPWFRIKKNPTAVRLIGCFPMSSELCCIQLSKTQKPFRRLRIIVGGTGMLPSILAGLAYPILSDDAVKFFRSRLGISTFKRIQCGSISRNRWVFINHKFIPIFTSKKDFFSNASDVPLSRLWAIINGEFCLKDPQNIDIPRLYSVSFERADKCRSIARFSSCEKYFRRRPKATKNVIFKKLLNLLRASVLNFRNQRAETITAIVLDLNAQYGCVSVGIKTSRFCGIPERDESFEFPEFVRMNCDDLYGQYELMIETELSKVAVRSLLRFRCDSDIEKACAKVGLKVGYCVHDSPIWWVRGKRSV